MENKSFQQSMTRLEEIVKTLERNDIELEEAIQLFEEGLTLLKSCDQKLTHFDDKVKALLESYQEEENASVS